MSGVSNYVVKPLPPAGRDWRVHGNPPPTNYFKSREMNMNECADYDNYYYCPDFYQCYESDGYYYGSGDVPYYGDSQLYESSGECTILPYEEPTPSTSNAEDQQDFPERMKSDKSK